MYDYIKGALAHKSATAVVLECGGVGYELTIPVSTFETLPGLEKTCRLYTYLLVREEVLALFGFSTQEERFMFRKLINVNSVGPATAIAVLSSFSVTEFIKTVQGGEFQTIMRVKGIGRKTAEKIIVDLKDAFNNNSSFNIEQIELPGGSIISDAINALSNLGYMNKDAEKRVMLVIKDNDNDRLEDVIKKALTK